MGWWWFWSDWRLEAWRRRGGGGGGRGWCGEVGYDGLGVVALESSGEVLDAVMVHGDLVGVGREGCCELLEELGDCVAEAPMCFENDWCDWAWVVLASFVALA